METRKLQEVGGGTYTVSIPKEWARAHGFEAGMSVNLYTHLDGSIVVRGRTNDGENLAAVRLDVDGSGPERVKRTLRAALAVGFEAVTLARAEPFTAEERRAVNAMVRGLVGTEVVDEADDEITVRNLLDASDVSVRQSVVQLEFVALSMHRRATTSLVEDPTDGAGGVHEQLRERGAEAERLFGMVSRHFSRALVSLEEIDRLDVTRPDLFDYYETARHLRGVAREAVAVARAGEQSVGPMPSEVSDAADATRSVVEDASSAVLGDGEVETIHRALDRSADTRDEIDGLDATLVDESTPTFTDSVVDAVATARILDSLARTLDHGDAVADVAIRAFTRNEHL
ncbi:AbrB/MazE/SpoVT family DNA-binding domain-containing protein [Salinigranum salinum]|uniref:AbrB/MazE/SpoVT family DNA-binding domain-containing protein n=1 Tax=Salinigranum salinum TaxID=1364937 RepID=UPI0012607210|nr:AbrB/MazE/SpoVT family DNA-binding domain-containing protein [Salinigranum salinum]